MGRGERERELWVEPRTRSLRTGLDYRLFFQHAFQCHVCHRVCILFPIGLKALAKIDCKN